MRVVCNTVSEFLECIAPDEQVVLANTIRRSRYRRPVGGTSPRNAVKFLVGFQLSAVILMAQDAGDYLLEVGVECGFDYTDASQEIEGTESADKLEAEVAAFCTDHKYKLRPGVIHV